MIDKEEQKFRWEAALATLQTLLGKHGDWTLQQENDSGMFAEDYYAKRAVEYADALIRQLKENK